MDRRDFLRTLALPAVIGGVLSGCSGSSQQTGGTVQATEEDRNSMEASAAAYKSMAKGKK